MRCEIDGCSKPVALGSGKLTHIKSRLCWAHIKRAQRERDSGEPVRPYRMTGIELLQLAALRFAAAECDKDFQRATKQLREYSYRARSRPRDHNVQVTGKAPSSGR